MFDRLRPYLFPLLIATVLWSFVMGFEANRIATAGVDEIPAHCYFTGNPIVDAELSPRVDCFTAVVEKGAATPDQVALNIKLFRINTWMDFLFILLYLGSFVLFAKNEACRWSSWVIGFIFVSACCDVLENVRILGELTSRGGLLPQYFSLAKWVLLALALLSTAILVWECKGRLYRCLSTVFLISAVLLVVGLVIPEVMVFAGIGFALSFLLILARVFPYSSSAVLLWIEYAYLLRFQIASAAILFLALPLAYHFVPSLFLGLFDALGFPSFLFIVWAAFQLAWTIMITARLVFVYGPDRFVRATSIHPTPVGTGLVVIFGLLAVPLVAVLFYGTDRSEVTLASKVLATALGLFLAVAMLALTASLHFAIEDPGNSANLIFPSFGFLSKGTQTKSKFWESIGLYLNRALPEQLKPGILDREKPGAPPRLRSGHEMAAIALGSFVLLYVFLGIGFSPAYRNPDKTPAAMFFLLVLLAVLTWFFAGASFFLDSVRLPVFSTLLTVSLLIGMVGTDHQYVRVKPHTSQLQLSPSTVVDRWKDARGKGKNTAIVVATAGGGIRAAAWTTEVITRLQQGGCTAMSDSLLLVSSVSGGSVGAMFAVAQYDDQGHYPTSDAELRSIRSSAERSSLAAVGWGVAYPDLVRTVPVLGSVIVPQSFDRGWSLENAWSSDWKKRNDPTPLMGQWRNDVSQGHRPAVIFNATASESGERFLLSSTDGTYRGSEKFFDLFPSRDIAISTAARLSATFPYASPLTSASMAANRKAYHVGDGGYYDNSGLLSTVEWLNQASEHLQNYQVLLILIDTQPGDPRPGETWSWQKQIVGPVETLLHVRTSSQQVRSSIELEMAKSYLENPISGGSRAADPVTQPNPVNVLTKKFLFWSSTDHDPPLSWHLTPRQRKEIGEAWAGPGNRPAWEEVRKILGCTTDRRILDEAQEGE